MGLNFSYFKNHIREIYRRMMRHDGSPEYISRGVAIGLFIGFFIPISIQLCVAIPLAFLLRASKFMAAAFTFVTNPITIFIIYPIQCYIGSFLIFNPLSMREIEREIRIFTDSGDASVLVDMGWQLIGSFFAGGLLFGLISAIIGYQMSYAFVTAIQKRRQEHKRNGKKVIRPKAVLTKVINLVHAPRKDEKEE